MTNSRSRDSYMSWWQIAHAIQNAVDESLLVKYLLGKLTEEEQVRVEDRAFAEPGVHARAGSGRSGLDRCLRDAANCRRPIAAHSRAVF